MTRAEIQAKQVCVKAQTLLHPIEEDTIHLLKSEVFAWLFSAAVTKGSFCCYRTAAHRRVSFCCDGLSHGGAVLATHTGAVCSAARRRVCALECRSVTVVLVLHLSCSVTWDLPDHRWNSMIACIGRQILNACTTRKVQSEILIVPSHYTRFLWHY